MATAKIKYLKTDDKHTGAMFPQAAAADAARRNRANFTRWTRAQVQEATEVQRMVSNALSPKSVYVNYRERFIAVNAHNPAPCMTQAGAIKKLEQYCTVNKIEMLETAGHRIFRMFKK